MLLRVQGLETNWTLSIVFPFLNGLWWATLIGRGGITLVPDWLISGLYCPDSRINDISVIRDKSARRPRIKTITSSDIKVTTLVYCKIAFCTQIVFSWENWVLFPDPKWLMCQRSRQLLCDNILILCCQLWPSAWTLLERCIKLYFIAAQKIKSPKVSNFSHEINYEA